MRILTIFLTTLTCTGLLFQHEKWSNRTMTTSTTTITTTTTTTNTSNGKRSDEIVGRERIRRFVWSTWWWKRTTAKRTTRRVEEEDYCRVFRGRDDAGNNEDAAQASLSSSNNAPTAPSTNVRNDTKRSSVPSFPRLRRFDRNWNWPTTSSTTSSSSKMGTPMTIIIIHHCHRPNSFPSYTTYTTT